VSRDNYYPIHGHYQADNHADELVAFETGQSVPIMIIFI